MLIINYSINFNSSSKIIKIIIIIHIFPWQINLPINNKPSIILPNQHIRSFVNPSNKLIQTIIKKHHKFPFQHKIIKIKNWHNKMYRYNQNFSTLFHYHWSYHLKSNRQIKIITIFSIINLLTIRKLLNIPFNHVNNCIILLLWYLLVN